VDARSQFAANLLRLRVAAGLTQEGLSDRSGLHSTEISRLERGVRDPRLSTIVRVARALGVPPADLLAEVS
jgi:transcriptional regulator with XRE-family HTH domain